MTPQATHTDRVTAKTGISGRQPCFTTPKKDVALCLSLTCDDGSVYTPEFMHLIDKFYLSGKGILLFFNHCTVTILGHRFRTLYDKLNSREVAAIHVHDDPFDEEEATRHFIGVEDEEKAHVTSITVTYGQPDIPSEIEKFLSRTH